VPPISEDAIHSQVQWTDPNSRDTTLLNQVP
jgi:hypothetical protein